MATEVRFDPSNRFYHATNDFYADLIQIKIIVTKRKGGGVDFGPGFYLTQNKEQAIEWATGKAEANNWGIPDQKALELAGMTIRDFFSRKDSLKPVIIEYAIKDPDYWEQLIKDKKLRLFNKANIYWKRHVWTWRTATEPPDKWLATFGPLADGGISTPDPNNVKSFRGSDQLAIHDEDLANTHLELLEVNSC